MHELDRSNHHVHCLDSLECSLCYIKVTIAKARSDSLVLMKRWSGSRILFRYLLFSVYNPLVAPSPVVL